MPPRKNNPDNLLVQIAGDIGEIKGELKAHIDQAATTRGEIKDNFFQFGRQQESLKDSSMRLIADSPSESVPLNGGDLNLKGWRFRLSLRGLRSWLWLQSLFKGS